MKNLKVKPGKYLSKFTLVFLLLIIPASNIWADDQRGQTDCSQIENDEKRLKCYDEIASPKKVSYLSKLWELDKEVPRDKYSFMPHRSN